MVNLLAKFSNCASIGLIGFTFPSSDVGAMIAIWLPSGLLSDPMRAAERRATGPNMVPIAMLAFCPPLTFPGAPMNPYSLLPDAFVLSTCDVICGSSVSLIVPVKKLFDPLVTGPVRIAAGSVSYTHLTLPTNREV